MYGEKVEENEELKMDLDDVKSLYKQQVKGIEINFENVLNFYSLLIFIF